MLTQYIILTVVLLLAILYVVRALIKTIRTANDPCGGCSGCAIHEQAMKKTMSKHDKVAYCHKN
ncbi:FeoB-associated Cys-rich membrane protein [Prevotella sp. HUN102]|uniref:FeoB-associated Cys-rich membrane protein n=1 Tax=Prevotella sp. HUN102 TaxID=1392486 RepID=UPI000B11E4A7